MTISNIENLIIYQVYPRSFMDSNGDGIGDLAGITAKLDYIADLGVDYVWINPFFTSPMKDFGYDVSDYLNVDPIFGKLEDFERLITKALDLKLKIMIDLVISHSSDQHPWFLESSQNRNNSKSDFYVWAESSRDIPPNNWLSVFGSSAWQYHEKRKQFYLHSFLKEQPDLNFHNSIVQQAILDVCKFWMKKGIQGIRLDTVNHYFHDKLLRHNPLKIIKKNSSEPPPINPYDLQEHLYDKNRPENIIFLKQLRKLADQYDCLLLGEVGADDKTTKKIIKEYTKNKDRLHLCYGFDYFGKDFSATFFEKTISDFWSKNSNSMICNSFSNHDSVRHISRWKHDPKFSFEFAKLCISLIIFLKGAICLYQGEELGLSEYIITKKQQIKDPFGLNFFPKFKGRDGCRTPMVWDNTKRNSGFSTSGKTWLPIPPEHTPKAAEQQQNPGSLLTFYKKMIAFRKRKSALKNGSIKAEILSTKVLKITRQQNKSLVVGYFNLSAKSTSITKQIEKEPSKGAQKNTINLTAYGCVFY